MSEIRCDKNLIPSHYYHADCWQDYDHCSCTQPPPKARQLAHCSKRALLSCTHTCSLLNICKSPVHVRAATHIARCWEASLDSPEGHAASPPGLAEPLAPNAAILAVTRPPLASVEAPGMLNLLATETPHSPPESLPAQSQELIFSLGGRCGSREQSSVSAAALPGWAFKLPTVC